MAEPAEFQAAVARDYTVRQAAFIGVGAMVGAGIFSLLGAAGEVAGAAVWISFLLAGGIAGLQGYSFAKLGATLPSAGGLLEYVTGASASGTSRRSSRGSSTPRTSSSPRWSRSRSAATRAACSPTRRRGWPRSFAVLVVVAMTVLNVAGSTVVARVQSVIVFVVVGILALFAVVTIANADLAPGAVDLPERPHIVSSVALTFFAFLGFGVVTFTAKDLPDPSRQLPRAMDLAIGIATVVYVAVALGVFGTLTVDEVIASGPTAIAVAASPCSETRASG